MTAQTFPASDEKNVLAGSLTVWFDELFSQFDEWFDATKQSVSVFSAGLTIECRSCDSQTLQLIAHGHREIAQNSSPEVKLLHVCNELTPGVAYPIWPFAFFNERDVEKQLLNGRYRFHYFDDLKFWQILDQHSLRGIQFARSPDELPLWENGSPLRNFINWALIQRGAGLVHAGTLGTDRAGVLIAGKGGSGKSGTVIGGLMNDLTSVGDDYVSVTCGKSITASCAFQTLKVDPTGAIRAGIPDEKTQGRALNWQHKFLLNLDDLNSSSDVDPLPIIALLVPRITYAEKTTFKPLSSKEAFVALAPSGVTQMPCARPEMIAHCAKIARSLPAFEMQLGTDATEISTAILKFIEGRKS